MSTIIRGFKNAFRNNVRTISIIIILSISISMSLVMFISLKTVQQRIEDVKSSTGNGITVSPAGIRGFEGGGELLTETNANTISKLSNVLSITKTLSDRLSPDTDTNLQSAIEAGSFGERQRGFENRQNNQNSTDNQSNSSNSNQQPQNMTMPITITGTNNLSNTTSLNVSSLNITSGKKFNETSSDFVALVGKSLAEKNNLSVGSTFTAHDKTIKVVGIYDGGNNFANANIIMPIKTVQNISDQSGKISSIIVQTNSIDNINSVVENIKEKLGDTADVVSQQSQTSQVTEPLENIRTISLYSLIGSVAAGTIIIFLTMVMIVRERRKEIGVLKAIGASNVSIIAQFASESMFLTLTSSIIGIILGAALSNPILKVLLNNSSSSSSVGGPGLGGGSMMQMARGIMPGIQNLKAIIGPDIIIYGILAAIIIGILGSIIPSFIIAKVRPAEVLRSD